MALKPLPKAIGILLIVAAVGFSATKFLPKTEPKPEVAEQVQPTRVETPVATHSESSALSRANEATSRAREAQETRAAVLPESEPEPATTVSNGSRGMDALLKAGKK